ncbi:MAG: PAS domain-containing protein [Sandaracinaceae bacterium]|nr:PAS domain-containing protein [Sandaracinaceae bacterium]
MSTGSPRPPSTVAELALRLGAIGDRPEDDESERLRHRLLVFMGVLMSVGGLLWGSLAMWFGLWMAACIPYAYVVITALNLLAFRATKRFSATRTVQVLASLLLPFLFQWSLGGFESSGAVMLWAMLALVGSLTFSKANDAIGWIVVYAILTAASGLLEPVVHDHFSVDPAPVVRTTFFVINVVTISSIVFGLTIYILFSRESTQRALTDANARVTELNEQLEDLVERRTEELREALERTRAIVDNMADGLVAIGTDHRIQAANPALTEMLFIREDLIGRPALSVLPDELPELAKRCMASGEVERADLELQGERIAVAVASPLTGAQGHGIGAVVILRDVTLEREVDRMKTDFIATVSHELRTPLTSVLGFAKLSRNKLEATVFPHVPDEDRKAQKAARQIRDNLDIVVQEAERLTALIGDVLDISKMESGQVVWRREVIEPATLVTRAIEATAGLFTGARLHVEQRLDEGLPAITGDSDRLLQVLINLISNAAKFTDEGFVRVGARQDEGAIVLFVEDSGVGISEADQSAIFKKFRQVGDTMTSKPKGTGLGLPICVQIVEAHGGSLTVHSLLGAGSRFDVRLPVHRLETA